jgi:hypothetical protein
MLSTAGTAAAGFAEAPVFSASALTVAVAAEAPPVNVTFNPFSSFAIW